VIPINQLRFPRSSGASYVYAIQSGGYVKIGLALNVRTRLSTLQVGNPVKLRLIGLMAGTKEDEAEIHAELGAHYHFGEWFELNPSVEDVLNRRMARTTDAVVRMFQQIEAELVKPEHWRNIGHNVKPEKRPGARPDTAKSTAILKNP
jgi:hypothetical protein